MLRRIFSPRHLALPIMLAAGGWINCAHAATIGLHDDPVMSCYLRLDGPLERGDDAVLASMLAEFSDSTSRRDSPSSPRVCLNSASGDYATAFDIIDHLGGTFSTAVAPGDSCSGACAVMFMAGREGGGGTLDSDQGGRIMHPMATLRFGRDGGAPLDTSLISRLVGLQDTYDIHPQIIQAMLGSAATGLETVGQAALWQIRVGPTVMPDQLSALAVLNACTNARAALINRLRFAEGDLHESGWPERETPEVTTSESGIQYGNLPVQINRMDVDCNISFYGAHSLPTGNIGGASFTLGGTNGGKLYRRLYGAMMFTPATLLQTLARQSDSQPQAVSVAALSGPDVTTDTGLCGRIANGTLTAHFRCARTMSEAPDDELNAMMRTTFDSGDGTVITATATGEYGRSWPENMEPEHTLDGVVVEAWIDGMPDEGEDGNDPGADSACRVATDGQSQWCPTSFWRRPDTNDVFFYIADKHVAAGLEYAGWD